MTCRKDCKVGRNPHLKEANMTKTKMLIEEAKKQEIEIKQIVIELLTAPMAEDQKELVLKLYRMVK
jgi:hypothetical protein